MPVKINDLCVSSAKTRVFTVNESPYTMCTNRWTALAAAILISFPLWSSSIAAAENGIGIVRAASGSPILDRQGRKSVLKPGASLHRNDRVQTERGARIHIAFTNSSDLRVGENTTVYVRDYARSANNEHGRLLLDVAAGAIQFTAAPNTDVLRHKVYLRLPEAGLSALGASYWTGPIDGRRHVILLEGRVEIRNSAGSVVLRDPDTVTILTSQSSPPGPPRPISGKDKRRALGMTVVR